MGNHRMSDETNTYTVGFMLEQTLGHVTHCANLQQNVPNDPTVAALWGLVPWEVEGWAAQVPGYRNNWTLRAGLRARSILGNMQRQSRLDALFFHTQVPAVLLSDQLSRFPSVISLDATPLQYDTLSDVYGHNRSAGWLEQQKKRLNRICFQRARRLVTWSNWTAQSLIEDYGVPAAKISVIPPGVNTDAWQRPSPRLHNSDKGLVKILFVGGDLWRKGGQNLLEAFHYLRAELDGAGSETQIELHLVTRADLQNEPGIFVYRDMQPNSAELKSLFQACDVFCLPTLGDCLPMVLSEAGAAGLPLISTDVGAIKEIVRHEQTGLLIEPHSVAALVVALRSLVQQPALRLQLGENALKLVRRQYDAPHNTNRLLDVIKQTVDEARVTNAAKSPAAKLQIGHRHG